MGKWGEINNLLWGEAKKEGPERFPVGEARDVPAADVIQLLLQFETQFSISLARRRRGRRRGRGRGERELGRGQSGEGRERERECVCGYLDCVHQRHEQLPHHILHRTNGRPSRPLQLLAQHALVLVNRKLKRELFIHELPDERVFDFVRGLGRLRAEIFNNLSDTMTKYTRRNTNFEPCRSKFGKVSQAMWPACPNRHPSQCVTNAGL